MRILDWVFGPVRNPRRRAPIQAPRKLRAANPAEVRAAIDSAALAAADRVLARAHGVQNLLVAGYNRGVSFLLNDVGPGVAITVKSHSWQEEIEKIDVTNTSTAGLQALLAGILRGTGTVEGFFDTTAMLFSASPGVKAGASGVMVFNFGAPNTQYTVPTMVTKLNHKSEVAGAVTWNFDVELNCLAGVSQAFVSYVYPT